MIDPEKMSLVQKMDLIFEEHHDELDKGKVEVPLIDNFDMAKTFKTMQKNEIKTAFNKMN